MDIPKYANVFWQPDVSMTKMTGKPQPTKRLFDLAREFEGLKLEAYQDIRGIWTIGIGTTRINGKPVKKGMIISPETAYRLFNTQMQEYWDDVLFLTKGIDLKLNQLEALTDFAYNVGPDIDADTIAEGLGDSTLLKVIKANPADPSIQRHFEEWDNSGSHHHVAGLIRRRKAEAWLYFNNELKFNFAA